MRSIKEALELSDKDELKEELKEHVRVRDMMGGNLYWNILNDECCQIANKCLSLGISRDELSPILGTGTFY